MITLKMPYFLKRRSITNAIDMSLIPKLKIKFAKHPNVYCSEQSKFSEKGQDFGTGKIHFNSPSNIYNRWLQKVLE